MPLPVSHPITSGFGIPGGKDMKSWKPVGLTLSCPAPTGPALLSPINHMENPYGRTMA